MPGSAALYDRDHLYDRRARARHRHRPACARAEPLCCSTGWRSGDGDQQAAGRNGTAGDRALLPTLPADYSA